MYQGIIFDLDGTLWDSTRQILPAWNAVLRRCGKDRRLTCKDMEGFMGKTAAQIAALMLPEEPLEESISIVKECCQEELSYLEEHGGTLYAGLRPTLSHLSASHRLFIVSNCQEGYIEAFLKAHDLGHYFKDFQCEGHTGRSKGENIKAVMARNHLVSAVYVGDTQGDLDASDAAGVPFIHAAYGFGQVCRCVPEIHCLEELGPLCD